MRYRVHVWTERFTDQKVEKAGQAMARVSSIGRKDKDSPCVGNLRAVSPRLIVLSEQNALTKRSST